jgi:apolipoprotein N-acyltransferase
MTDPTASLGEKARPARPGRADLLVALLSGALLCLAFPKASLDLLAWVAPAPLLVLCVSRPSARAALLGFLFGMGFFVPHLYWIGEVVHVHGEQGLAVAVLAVVLLAAILSAYLSGVSALLSRAARRLGAPAALALSPFLWVAGELARGWPMDAFPWAVIGCAASSRPALLQVSALGGIAFLSFLMVFTSAALALAWVSPGPGARRPALAVALLVPALTWLGGTARLGLAPPPGEGELRAAVIQGNRGSDWEDPEGTLQVYERLTRKAAREGARLVVWPESAVHALWLEQEGPGRDRLRALARETGAELVVNDLLLKEDERYGNAAVIVGPEDGAFGPWYEKLHLVPFGEYVPWQGVLPFVKHFTEEVGDFSPGEEQVLLEAAGRRLAILVCYEAIFPGLASAAARGGADLLVNLTNDAWFGRSAGPRQHLALALPRTVETGRPLLRAANTGVSTVIDRWGRSLGELEVGEEGYLLADLEPGKTNPPAVFLGPALPWACAIVSLLSLAPRPRRRSRSGAGKDARS